MLLWLATSADARAQFPPSAKAAAEDEATIRGILKDWQDRWEKLERVDYRLKGTRAWKAAVLDGADIDAPPGPIPKRPFATPVERRVEIDFRNRRARHEADLALFGMGGQPRRSFHADLFDGEDRTWFSPRDRQPPIPESHIWAEVRFHRDDAVIFFNNVDPLLFAHGIVGLFPNVREVGSPRRDPRSFEVIGRETLGGAECVVLRDHAVRANRELKFWVDESRESAIRRMHYDMNGRLKDSIEIEPGETERGWMPRTWVHRTWRSHGPPSAFLTERLEVIETVLNPPLPVERFRVELRPGTAYSGKGDKRTMVYRGEGLPPIEAREYWIRKGWAERPKGEKPRAPAPEPPDLPAT